MKRYISLCLMLGFFGCFGPPVASISGLEGEKEGVQFRFGPLGASWDRIEVGEEDLTFIHSESGATAGMQVSCKQQYEDAPLRSLTRHLWIGMTDIERTDRQTVMLAGREALDTSITAKLDGVELKMRSLVVKKDGCIYDFVLSLPRPTDQRWVSLQPDFESFYSGFEGPLGSR